MTPVANEASFPVAGPPAWEVTDRPQYEGGGPTGVGRITESGDFRITEDGSFRKTE